VLGSALGLMESFIFFETVLVAVLDKFADTNTIKHVFLVAPFAFTKNNALLFFKSKNEMRLVRHFNENGLVLKTFVFERHNCANERL
jgi:hypothetical protein